MAVFGQRGKKRASPQKTGCGQTHIKNSGCFDHQRKQAKLAFAPALETPEVFLAEHDCEAAKTPEFAFARAATTASGYLAEPARKLLAESTGLSNRVVIDFIPEIHQNPEFAGIAAGIANVELRDPSTMAGTTQRTDISISQRLPTSSATGARSAAPIQVFVWVSVNLRCLKVGMPEGECYTVSIFPSFQLPRLPTQVVATSLIPRSRQYCKHSSGSIIHVSPLRASIHLEYLQFQLRRGFPRTRSVQTGLRGTPTRLAWAPWPPTV